MAMSSYAVVFYLILAIQSLFLCDGAIPDTWITTYTGTCRIILSSPHGGSLKPSSIADRQHGCLNSDGSCLWDKTCTNKSDLCRAVVGTDLNTLEITYLLIHSLIRRGCFPFFVGSNLHRSKLDPNRDIPEAAQQDPEAMEAWHQYHNALTSARQSVLSEFKRGLVFDIHGQAHPENWTEIGTLISKDSLNAQNYTMAETSLRALSLRSQHPAKELTGGKVSFGGLLSAKGYKVVPSPEHVSPGTGGFFSGGFITQTYGSRSLLGEVDAIQVEITRPIRESLALYTKFVENLADVMMEFLKIHDYNV